METALRSLNDERRALIEPMGDQAEGDLVRYMLSFAADRIMEMHVGARTGAMKGAPKVTHQKVDPFSSPWETARRWSGWRLDLKAMPKQ